MNDAAVLVVGGAGYIGSHMAKSLHSAGVACCTLDDLSTGFRDAVSGSFVEGPMQDPAAVAKAVKSSGASAAMLFAGFIQVAESVADPEKYHQNNVVNTGLLIETLCQLGVRHLVFSSSAAVYGEPRESPIPESHPLQPVNPYGRSKLLVEQSLPEYERKHGLRWVALRYFNAAGAHPDADIGERHEPETHLIPLALRAASGRLPRLTVNGTDYSTTDGTCVRDYVHVCDLVDAHLLALEYLRSGGASRAFNLGNGKGFSVRQVLDAAERVTGRKVPVVHGPRREGDPAVLVADSALARSVLGWKPRFDHLDTIVAHAWAWEQRLAARTAKPALYASLLAQASSLFEGERDATANAANLAALLFHGLPDLNWAGFYWMKGDELVLGPFQGKPACVRIALGKGVCGTAAASACTVVVPDVHAFPGHIACDSASESEVVVPVMRAGAVLGVLDLDSPRLARFDDEDARALEALVAAFVAATDL
jgi:UDP-glucose 4-epimerase